MKTKIANFAMVILAVVLLASCSESEVAPKTAVSEQIRVEDIVFKASDWNADTHQPSTVQEIGGGDKPYTITNSFTYNKNEFGEISIIRTKVEGSETRNYLYTFSVDSLLIEITVEGHWRQQYQYNGNKLASVYTYEYDGANYVGDQRDEITWTGNAISKVQRYAGDFVQLLETYNLTAASTDNSFAKLAPALALCAMEEFEYFHFFTGKDFSSLTNENAINSDYNFSYQYSNTYDSDGHLNFMNRLGSGNTKPNSNIGLVWIGI